MIETGPVIKLEPTPASLFDSGPVIKLDTVPPSPLESSRWRTVAPDSRRPVGWASTERERCVFVCGNDRRCMLRDGHGGVHAWRSLGGLRIFEWTE